MSDNILIIGGVALGPKAAARCKRANPSANVTMIDQDDIISYGGCGIPYYISGDVPTIEGLRMTTAHVLRDPKFFEEVKNVNARIGIRALKINREDKTVLVENVRTKEQETLAYDKLVIATGASARALPVENANLENVLSVTNIHEALKINELCASGQIQNAVVVGAGFIGLEVAVAFADMWGINTTVVEYCDQVLPQVSNEHSAQIAEEDLKKLDITLALGEKVQKLEGKDGKVTAVVTDKQTIEADLVISAIGFVPNSELAKDAGLALSPNNAIIVDKYMRTNDENIYSGGDCCSVKNIITNKDGYIPLGSMANRQGRVIGSNLAGKSDTFDGYVGTWCVKLNELSFAGVGLTLPQAEKEGFDAICITIEGTDHAHFYPDAVMTCMQMVVEKKTRKILGFQASSTNADAVKARVDAVAVLMQYADLTVEKLSNAEIAYAPPFASAMDIINTIANVADNALDDRFEIIDPNKFSAMWDEKSKDNTYFIDIRPPHPHVLALQEKYPDSWLSMPLEELQARINEIPKDRPLALVCSTGTRSYETMVVLKDKGYTNVLGSIMGGMSSVAKRGDNIS